MKRCPLTYETIPESEMYSRDGLKRLDRRLQSLDPLAYSAEEQRQEALARAGKMSIQGIQPKLSAVLNVKNGSFDLVDRDGTFILKPQSRDYPNLPENEDLTMRLARQVGIDTPLHGLVRSIDGSLTYFVERFDRAGKRKVSVEDFAQLLGKSRDTKYSSSMEQVATTIESFCTFPTVEKVKLLRLTLFSFLVGNEDMHLKNFSVIVASGKVELSPAYDLVNSTVVLRAPEEELALPVRGKRARITKDDLFRYFAKDRLGLNDKVIADVKSEMNAAIPPWQATIEKSFLPETQKRHYEEIISERVKRVLE